jgi:hypothetical protein
MATTDEYVKYDIRFFEEFMRYLDFDEADMNGLRKAVEMGLIQRDRLVELAISKIGKISMDSTTGQDLADTTDVKSVVSGIRNNDTSRGCWTHSFAVHKIANKNGPLRVVAYNKILDKFHYFFIPKEAYSHCKVVEIIVETFRGIYNYEPTFTGNPKKHLKWWQYEVHSFEEMCSIQPGQVGIRCNNPKLIELTETKVDTPYIKAKTVTVSAPAVTFE